MQLSGHFLIIGQKIFKISEEKSNAGKNSKTHGNRCRLFGGYVRGRTRRISA
jgi:hypothetical protein